MNVQLDWQAANDDGDWESIAQVGTRTRLRLPGWVWHVAATAVVLLAVGAAIGIRYRYRRALRQVTVQIQDVVDLEACALARGDVERYLAQQDTALPGWVAQQAVRIRHECPEVDAPAPGLCPLAAPVQVARVEMRGDVAWVEVVQPQTSLRHARFYRQTRQGWLHTAPHARFWQDPVELALDRVIVRAGRRDLPYLDPQMAHIVDVVDDVCATLDCSADIGLEVSFTHHDGPPMLSGTALTLASPWLTGIPVDGSRDEGYARALTYWVVYGLASQIVHSDHDERRPPWVVYGLASQIVRSDYDERWQPGPAYPPDPTREEMLHVCATLYRPSGRHGEDVRPEMLGVMWGACSLQGFVAH